MSRAFLKESTLEEEAIVPRPVSLLPSGARNYLTSRGHAKLQNELARLIEHARPSLAVLASDDPETKRQRQVVEQRISHLQHSLRTAAVEDRPGDPGVVSFGATVVVRDTQGKVGTYSLVGVDEAEPELNRVSWQAPISKALWHARVGQKVRFKFPAGQTELEITQINYD